MDWDDRPPSAFDYLSELDDADQEEFRINLWDQEEVMEAEEFIYEYYLEHDGPKVRDDALGELQKTVRAMITESNDLMERLSQSRLRARLEKTETAAMYHALLEVCDLMFLDEAERREALRREAEEQQEPNQDEEHDGTLIDTADAGLVSVVKWEEVNGNESTRSDKKVQKPKVAAKTAKKPAAQATGEPATASTSEKPVKATKPKTPRKKKQETETTDAATSTAAPKKASRKAKAAPKQKPSEIVVAPVPVEEPGSPPQILVKTPVEQKTPSAESIAEVFRDLGYPSPLSPTAPLSPLSKTADLQPQGTMSDQDSENDEDCIEGLKRELLEAESKLQEARTRKRKAIDDLKSRIAKVHTRRQKVEAEIATLGA